MEIVLRRVPALASPGLHKKYQYQLFKEIKSWHDTPIGSEPKAAPVQVAVQSKYPFVSGLLLIWYED